MENQNIQVTGFMKPADKTADGNPQPIILQNITVRPINRQSQDIKKWRAAHRSAEGYIPRRVLLYDLYADVMLDGHVIAVTGKRVDAVTKAKWHFVDKDGKPVDAVNDIIDSIGFSDLLKEIVNSKFWGYSMIECDFFKDFRGNMAMTAYQCDRKHMRPDLGIISQDQNTDTGINIRDGIYPSFILEAGNPKDLGLLLSAAQYAILKDGDLSDYSAFVQTFGQPIFDAEWDGFDENQRLKLVESLTGVGPGGVVTRPSGTKVNLLEAKANADGKLHTGLFDICNKEISKALIGSTEGTESSDSSGYAQSQTHLQVESNKNETDIDFVRRILNSRWLKILEDNGIDTKGGKIVVQESEEQLSKKDAFDIYKSMMKDLGIPISDDFFYENFNVPKPDDYDTQKAALEAKKAQFEENSNPQNPANNADTPPVKSGKKSKKPDDEGGDSAPKPGKLAKLIDAVGSFFQAAPAQVATGATMTPVVMMGCCGNHPQAIERYISLGDIKQENSDLIERMFNGAGNITFDATLFQNTAQTLLDGLQQGWIGKPMVELADLGFTYGIDDPALLTSFEMNLFRFAGVKTLAEAQELNRIFRQSKGFPDFNQRANQVTDTFNKVWRQTEYQTAYLTGESSATYVRLMKQTELFPYWEYKTVGDSKVRPEHAALNGLILPANDPRWNKIYPPNGWNCRCYVVPRTKAEVEGIDVKANRAKADAYFDSPEFKTADAQGWGVNRAVTGEVFTANQQYIRKFEGKASKTLNSLGSTDFGLKSYSQAKKIAKEAIPEYKDTADKFFKDLLKDGKSILNDYNNRPIELNEGNFRAHTTGKKDVRVKYLEAMKQTLLNPDEVWLNGAKLNDLVYIKYYNDETLIVIADVTKANVTEVSTWYPLTESKVTIERARKGLLIKSGVKK